MKKALLTAFIISVLLISIVSGMGFNWAKANPYLYDKDGQVEPPPDAIYPTVAISSIKNDTVYGVNKVSLDFNITVIIPRRSAHMYDTIWFSDVYYKASWLSNNTYLDIEEYLKSIPPERMLGPSNEYLRQIGNKYIRSGNVLTPSFSINLTGMPEGLNYLEVFAVEKGYEEAYQIDNTIFYGEYELIGSSMVRFTIGTTPPNISNLSLTNTTYNSSDIPLSFNINETAQICYSLDHNANTTIVGNTTIAGISDGTHNIVVYANDSAGNVGSSNVVFFTINTQPSPSPSPTQSSSPTQEPTPTPSLSPRTSFPPSTPTYQYPLLLSILALIEIAIITVIVVRRKKKTAN